MIRFFPLGISVNFHVSQDWRILAILLGGYCLLHSWQRVSHHRDRISRILSFNFSSSMACCESMYADIDCCLSRQLIQKCSLLLRAVSGYDYTCITTYLPSFLNPFMITYCTHKVLNIAAIKLMHTLRTTGVCIYYFKLCTIIGHPIAMLASYNTLTW